MLSPHRCPTSSAARGESPGAMRSTRFKPSPASMAPCALIVAAALAAPAGALAADAGSSRASGSALGKLVQLRGPSGCVVDRSEATRRCTAVRALRGPAPFLGSNAVAISPDGKNVYVASSESDAIAIFKRKPKTGSLSQRQGTAGCISAKGARLRDGARARAPQLGRRERRRCQRLRHVLGEQRGCDLHPRSVDRRALAGRRRERLHHQRRDLRLHHRPRARRTRRRHRQPRRQQRLRGRVLRQRRCGLRPRPVDRRAHAAVRRDRLPRQRADRRLHHRARARGARGHGDQRRRQQRLRRNRRQQRGRGAHPRPLDRRFDAGDRRHRVHRQRSAHRLYDRHPTRRRERRRGQPGRRATSTSPR